MIPNKQTDARAVIALKLEIPDLETRDITTNEAVKRLKALQSSNDYEVAHAEADNILCHLLWSLGRRDVVIAWKKVGKYYS